MTKRCIHCNHDLPTDLFAPNPKNRDGLSRGCATCNEIRALAARQRREGEEGSRSQYAEWETLAGEVIEWYYRGATFEAMGRKLREKAKRLP